MAQSVGSARRTGTLILGATVRTLGAWPAGWRYPGAPNDPRNDVEVLTKIASAAEAAGLHFLYFGDWLATSAEYEYTDPYLLARIEPFAAIGYLAAITTRIGLIATVNSAHSEPYSAARSAASIDLLSNGRVGLVVTSGSERRSAANFGWSKVNPDSDRIASAAEFIEVLRGLWDSWQDDAFVADVEAGKLIESSRLHTLAYRGTYQSALGPLNVIRPPQGHVPVGLVGSAENARDLAARAADFSFITAGTLASTIDSYSTAKEATAAAGRDPADHVLLASILPVVAPTREGAWAIYDELVEILPVETVSGHPSAGQLPPNRTIRTLAAILGVPLTGILIDEIVPPRVAERFTPQGRRLIDVVGARSGRAIGGRRGITYRHLLVAHAVVAPIIVGSAEDVADHLESWYRLRAVDGFTVLSAFADQLEAFTTLVVPELQRRGLFPEQYGGASLRDHFGLEVPPNSNELVDFVDNPFIRPI